MITDVREVWFCPNFGQYFGRSLALKFNVPILQVFFLILQSLFRAKQFFSSPSQVAFIGSLWLMQDLLFSLHHLISVTERLLLQHLHVWNSQYTLRNFVFNPYLQYLQLFVRNRLCCKLRQILGSKSIFPRPKNCRS